MKYNNNIKGIFTLIITFFVISAFSRTTFDKRQEGYQNAEIFKPFTQLKPTPEPVTRYFDLELSRVYLAPDGVMTEVFAINSQYPGPILHVNKGDTISATIKNSLGTPSVIHWHGMFHKGTNWYDGVTGQTQCPIPNGFSFTYEFSTAEQSGTYWYHAHTHGQYMEGIRAPLIVHDPDDPYLKEYDYEYVITMSDWYHQRIEDMLKIRMSPNYGGFNPVPDSGLISGVGRYDCSADPDKSDCRPNNPLAVYRVEPGKRYRLRLINTSGYAHFIFSIDNHPLKIIEADGIYSKPQVVNKLPVAIGQRYSVLIEANQKVDNYWMRATIDERCIPTNDSTINVNSKINYNVTGILKYEGAESDYPRTKDYHDEVDACLSLEPNLLKMLHPEQLPGPATDKILFNITFGEDEKHIGRSFINNSSFVVNDHNPTLLEIAVKGRQVKDFDRNQNIYAYDNKDGTVDLTVLNANGGVHPFHIHGHVFYVLGTGPGLVVDESKLNFADPFPRDVFTLNSTSWTVFRYKANNPGIWSIHCHIEWHVEMGMVAQLAELPSEIQKLSVPNSVVNLCDQYSKSRKRSLPSRLSRRNSGYKVEMTKLR